MMMALTSCTEYTTGSAWTRGRRRRRRKRKKKKRRRRRRRSRNKEEQNTFRFWGLVSIKFAVS
jgi:hypothetical protein